MTVADGVDRRPDTELGEAGSAPEAIPAGRLRSVWRRVRSSRLIAGSTGGIDDAAMPSGFEAPYRRGTRYVRNLWHIPI